MIHNERQPAPNTLAQSCKGRKEPQILRRFAAWRAPMLLLLARYGLLAVLFSVALVLRLVVWQWREFYPLGGDEQEYLGQALTLLQEKRYVELRLMRPPLYGLFLAGSIWLVDSLVQNLRLLQAVISAATVIPVWLLTAELVNWYDLGRRARQLLPGLAALLCAAGYTLAANATELLTETLFLFGLTTLFWLLVRTAARPQRLLAGMAGVILGALCLTRAVALPLLPLGALWLLLATKPPPVSTPKRSSFLVSRFSVLSSLFFLGGTLLVVLPWTARNYATYGGLILIDTTGAENLWLDNDPAGREAVKAQLYAMGEDRLARQQLATQRGIDVITNNPGHFAGKAWNELQAFFALEYADDMRNRQAIWIPSAEVWTRLLLGDALWLLLILGGTMGLTRCSIAGFLTRLPGNTGRDDGRAEARSYRNRVGKPDERNFRQKVAARLRNPVWLFLPWAFYVVLTAMLFHVELRYRLPLYPVLLPYTALTLVPLERVSHSANRRRLIILQLLPVLLIIALMLLHRPYPAMAWQLGWKHIHLAQAERALVRGDAAAATDAAQAALARDPESVSARVALARAAQMAGDPDRAETILREAIDILPAHPQPHLLLGDQLRQQGDPAAARRELRYETASLQDLQTWAWRWFTTPPPTALDIGGGLDLGMIRGFHAPEEAGRRWTTAVAQVRLTAPVDADRLELRLASGRPETVPAPWLEVRVAGQSLGHFRVAAGWRDYTLLLPATLPAAATDGTSTVVIELRSPTFTPRRYDPAGTDGRTLGVMVDQIRLEEGVCGDCR
jgi:tetratricopeptide (TPR) repeat protein